MIKNTIGSDDYIWYVLALYGLNVYNKPLTKIQKWISYFTTVNLHFAAIYMTSCVVYILFSNENFKKGLAYCLATIFSISLWYSFLLAKKSISQVIQQIYSVRWGLTTKFSVTYRVCFVSMTLSPYIFTAILISFSQAFIKPQKTYWTYGYTISDKNLYNLYTSIGSYLYFLLIITTPILVTACICTLLHRCTRILGQYITKLKTFLEMDYNTRMDTIEDFFILSQMIENLTNILYTPTFLIIVGNFSTLFTSVESFLSKTLDSASIVYEISLISASAGVMILTLTLSCSMMSEKLEVIQITCRKIIDKLIFNASPDDKIISLLKRMEARDVTYVTAFGVVTFNRSFILSAFGALFTYSMLILSINSE